MLVSVVMQSSVVYCSNHTHTQHADFIHFTNRSGLPVVIWRGAKIPS